MSQRAGRLVSSALVLIIFMVLVTPVSLTYNVFVSEDMNSYLLLTQPISMASMASLAFTDDPEPWRFAFTRFNDVYPLSFKGAPTSIALDSRNFPHISFVYDNYLGLYHAFYNGTQWITETVDDVYPLESDIAIDSHDHAHATYTEYLNPSTQDSQPRVRYAYYNGSSWIPEVVDEEGFWSSLALDSQDNSHIAFFNGSGLQYAFLNGSTLTKKIVDSNSLNGLSTPSIALDSLNHPSIAYSGGLTETPKQLRYASFNGTSWNIQTIDGEGYGASLIIDSLGNPHISYRNATALKYAFFDGSSWNSEVVTTSAGAGTETSLVIDSESHPHVVYQSGGRVNYAYLGYSSWNITTINEDEGYDPGPWPSGGWYSGSGYSPSLSIGSDNKLRLSYIAGKYGTELRYGVGTKQFLTNFEFDDNSGTALYLQPSLARVNCPVVPGVPLVSVEWTTFSNRWLDSGSWTLGRIMWQETDVKPADAIYTPAPNGVWRVQTRVYSLNIKNQDQTNNMLTEETTLTFPNGTTLAKQTAQGWVNMTQVQVGTIAIGTTITVSKSERYVLLNPTSINLTENTEVDSVIWRHETTTLKVFYGPSTTYVGFHVNVSGRLTNTPEGDIPNATIILTYRVPGVSDWNLITSTATKSDGTFSVIWIPSATGYYTVNASWAGDDKYLGAEGIVNLAVIPVAEEYVFSVASNSTISALSFNSTSRELTFTVSGPSGTTGYVDATIAKTLISEITDVKVFIDGEEVACTLANGVNSWILHISYGLSTRTLTISLGPAPSTSPRLITPQNIILAAIGVSIIVGLAVGILKVRKGRPTPKAEEGR